MPALVGPDGWGILTPAGIAGYAHCDRFDAYLASHYPVGASRCSLRVQVQASDRDLVLWLGALLFV